MPLMPSQASRCWQVRPITHPVARITAAPRLYKDRLYVPIASLEEVEGAQAQYQCCTSRGAVVALDAITGKVIWTTYTIPDLPKVVKTAANGKEIWGPSGAGVWNSPTLDPKRNALYVGTGNGFTEPATKFSDAIIAMDLDTGKVLWSFQAHPRDIWHGGCQQAIPGRNPNAGGPQGTSLPPESCMSPGAPDWDFSASPMLVSLPAGRDLLVAGQKSGTVWAFDVDKKGALVWSLDVARVLPGGGGEIVFGGAADDRTAYFNLRSTWSRGTRCGDRYGEMVHALRSGPASGCPATPRCCSGRSRSASHCRKRASAGTRSRAAYPGASAAPTARHCERGRDAAARGRSLCWRRRNVESPVGK